MALAVVTNCAMLPAGKGDGLLDIRLLGDPTVTRDGAEVDVDTRKAIAMLAYLAMERTADRETLAGLLWAESAPERARATLRRTLSALRGGVGTNWVEADRNRVSITDGYVCDVDQFNAALEETATHEHEPGDVCPSCLPPLVRAAELYKGDFLGAFAVKDAPEFEDWARTIKESMRLKAGDTFRRLAMGRASAGEYAPAIEAANWWRGLDELHEPAYRLLMLLHAWAGDRTGSIRAYRDCVAVLDSELGVPPLDETTELYEAILDEDLPPAPGTRKPVRTLGGLHPAPREAMIGRRAESVKLQELLDAIPRSGRVLLVTGDAWMGKTRLIEYLEEVAPGLGATTISARAFRPESEMPYGVASQLLDDMTGEIKAMNADVPEWVRAELGRLAPKISPGRAGVDSGTLGHLRLREAFIYLLETATTTGPIVMTIDDAQWMDAASANLVSHLRRRLSNLPILLVISTSDIEALHLSMQEVAAHADDTITLLPLTPPDLGEQPPNSDLETIIDATGGIPLLVKEALDSGAVPPEMESLAQYVESRRRRLSGLAHQVMAAAAVLSGMCDSQLLRDTSGRTDDEIVEAVEELVSAGLLREHADGKLEFTLEALSNMTYESTSLTRRRLLHRRAAEALKARPRCRADPRLATATALHLRAAGSEEAAEWYLLAANLARSAYANDEAVNSYETAIALGHPDVGRIRLALGEIAMARGEYETAKRELRGAASRSTGPTLALVEHRTGDLHRLLGKFELAEESFTRAETEHPHRAELYADWALLEHRTGDTRSAIELAGQALEASSAEGDNDARARALNILGVVTPDTTEAMSHIDDALQLADSTDIARMAALNNKAHLLGGAGEHEAAIDLVNAAIDIASKAGYRHQRAALLNHLADLNHQIGRDPEARKALTEAVTVFADIDTGDWEPEVWFLRQW